MLYLFKYNFCCELADFVQSNSIEDILMGFGDKSYIFFGIFFHILNATIFIYDNIKINKNKRSLKGCHVEHATNAAKKARQQYSCKPFTNSLLHTFLF